MLPKFYYVDPPLGFIEPKVVLHFGSTNPCRITRKVEQKKMYICTLEEFILVDVVTLLYKLELSMELNMHWKCCSLYTITTIEEKG